MDRLGSRSLFSFLNGKAAFQTATNPEIRKDLGFRVTSYLELAAKIAELQFRNRDVMLLFRGQPTDHQIRDSTTLRPSIFRPAKGKLSLSLASLRDRYQTLNEAEQLLVERFQKLKRLGRTRVERQRLLRWAILQHYEVCDTPLLDVTQSLRIAASFASQGVPRQSFVYAIAVPNLSGAITASAEAGMQIIRLASVCPPSAIRPHIQEGYLLGEYPDFSSHDQGAYYLASQLDFGRRLIGKFRFDPNEFWSDPAFPRVDHDALYPSGKDWLETAVVEIRDKLKGSVASS